jgi:hypothetical protein
VSSLDLVAKAEALLQEQPAWPCVTKLQRFSFPLLRHTRNFFVKKWIPRFLILENGRLYYSDGKNGYPDSKEGTMLFMRSKPTPDGRYCIDITGSSTFRYRVVCTLIKFMSRLHCCQL